MNLSKSDIPDHIESKNRSQDIGRFFSSISPFGLFILIVIVGILIEGAGALMGNLRYKSGISEPEGPLSTAVGATLGLLAFILGFTFSLTWGRFANRNSLIILQAKSIETCYLRTSLVTEPQKTEIRKLLLEYTKRLINLNISKDFEDALERIEKIQLLIWQQTATLAKEDIDSELRSLFVQSVNEIISLVVERKTMGMVFRIPDPIWSSLFLLASMGMFAFGYQNGIGGITKLFNLPLLPIAFGIIIVLVADLNSTGVQRRFKVTRRPFEFVLEMMEKDTL